MRFKLYRATPSFCYFENHPYTIMHNRANPNSARGNCSGYCAIPHSAYTCKLIPHLVAIYNQIVFPGPLRGVYSLLPWLLAGKLLWWFCVIVGYAKLLLSRSHYTLYVHVQCMFDLHEWSSTGPYCVDVVAILSCALKWEWGVCTSTCYTSPRSSL